MIFNSFDKYSISALLALLSTGGAVNLIFKNSFSQDIEFLDEFGTTFTVTIMRSSFIVIHLYGCSLMYWQKSS